MDLSRDTKMPPTPCTPCEPCACVDLSGVDEDLHTKTPGVGPNGPNLTFAPAADFNDNNNRPSEAASRKRVSCGSWSADKDASIVEQIDTKNMRGVDTEPEETSCTRYVVEGGAEMAATAILMFMGCGGCYITFTNGQSTVYGGTAFGLAVFMSSMLFGEVSGAHMNPLVTLLHFCVGNMSWKRVVVYLSCQLVGAIAGHGLLFVVIPDYVQDLVLGAGRGVCTTVPLDDMTSLSALLAELIVTAILLSAVCSSISNHTPNHVASIQFGILIAGICFVEAPYTGASMNPTRSVAVALWTGVWDRFWVFLVGQGLAFAIVVSIYSFFRKGSKQD